MQRPRIRHRLARLAALGIALLLAGCQGVYYEAAEQFGVFKRDILVDRVETALESQEEAKETFVDALEQFSSVVDVPVSELDSAYRELAGVLEESEDRAADVRRRIEAVEDVSAALFDEWEDELSEYSNASLRRASERTLNTTKRRYADLIGAMQRAEDRIDPVLGAFRDQVLFMKHNLNARAIAALEGELVSIESDVATLLRDLDASISQSRDFVTALTEDAP